MAPLMKKRKKSSQSRTLIDFFSNNAPAKKSNYKSPKKSENFNVQPAQEVIIIDSDSGDDYSPKRHKGKAPEIQGDHGGPLTFGKPSALLQVPIQSSANHKQTLLQSPRIETTSIFGIPTSLLQSSVEPTRNLPEDYQNIITGNGCILDYPSVDDPASCRDPGDIPHSINIIDVDSDDKWGAGDDEQAILETTDDLIEMESVSEQFNDHMWSSDNPPATCPVCERDLSHLLGLEREHHVNQCLDSTVSSSSFITTTVAASVISTSCEPSTSKKLHQIPNTDLYSVMMASHQENDAWKEADLADDRIFRPTRAPGSRRKAPFYKVLQGMPIAVDAFRYGTIPGVTAYFLTHAHSDHYTNLASNWKSGPIYCSGDTANLIIHMLAVDPKWVYPLPMDVPTVVPSTGGVFVTLIEANHCPGSCLFLFEGPQTVHAGDSAFKSPYVGCGTIFRYLHCGDFRASPRHVMHPAVRGKNIDHVYLDTTYLDPKYTFPPQPLVISACAELAKKIVSGELIGAPDTNGKRNSTMDAWVMPSDRADYDHVKPSKERMLVVVGTYSIGKERIVKAIAQALETKIYCDAHKATILRCQNDPELHALLTKDPNEAGVHILPLGMIVSDKLKAYVQQFKGTYSRAVGFRPTGWTYTSPSGNDMSPPIPSIISRGQSTSFTYADLKPMQKSTYAVQLYGVPYSEHSSFFELTCFAMSCDWVKMIATVNVGSERSRAKMAKWVVRWHNEKKRGKEAMVNSRAVDYW